MSGEKTVEYPARSEWFKQVRNHCSSYDVKASGKSASAAVKAAEEVLETLDKLMVEGSYLSKQNSLWVKSPCSGNGPCKDFYP